MEKIGRTCVSLETREAFQDGHRLQIGEITSRLRHSPVVTLLGPGGAGKTHLAIEAARSMTTDDRVDVCFVSVAPVLHPDQVLNAAAQAFGIESIDELLMLPNPWTLSS